MLNKKIASEVAVGIILLLAIVVGGVFWLQNKKIENNTQQAVTTKIEVPKNATEIPVDNLPAGWKLYKHDVLGIKFIYPEYWGQPKTNPNRAITKLDGVVDEYMDETNGYYDSVSISFENNNDYNLGYHLPEVKIFGEKYKGEYYPNLYAHQYGYVDNIEELKKNKSVCNYKINFDTEYSNKLTEVWNSCENGVKEAMVRNKEIFDGEIGTLYSYEMKQFGYTHLKNGFFDNVLVSQDLGGLSQIKKDAIDQSEFIAQAKTGSLSNKSLSEKDLNSRRDDFTKFVASIQSFSPVNYAQGDFKVVSGENSDMTVIRRYYWLISSGKLQDAYNMYSNAKGISFEAFKKMYENVFFAKPADFKVIASDQYEFSVQYQEHNAEPTEYRVVMNVVNGKIETKSSVEILSKKAVFGEFEAYAIRRNNKNYVILKRNGNEEVIDQGDAEYVEDEGGQYENISDVKFFSEIDFSPNGKYLTYGMSGWEWSQSYIYDIDARKIVLTQDSPGMFSFNDDEKYFIACASSAFDGTYNSSIFRSNNFKKPIFNLLEYEKDAMTDYMNIDCEIRKDLVLINLNNDNWEGEGKDQKPASKVITYSLSQNKVIK